MRLLFTFEVERIEWVTNCICVPYYCLESTDWSSDSAFLLMSIMTVFKYVSLYMYVSNVVLIVVIVMLCTVILRPWKNNWKSCQKAHVSCSCLLLMQTAQISFILVSSEWLCHTSQNDLFCLVYTSQNGLFHLVYTSQRYRHHSRLNAEGQSKSRTYINADRIAFELEIRFENQYINHCFRLLGVHLRSGW